MIFFTEFILRFCEGFGMTQKTMAIIKIRELIGSSEKSFEDAMKNIVEHEVKKGKKITGAKIIAQSVSVEDGKIKEYKVNVNVAYRWEEDK